MKTIIHNLTDNLTDNQTARNWYSSLVGFFILVHSLIALFSLANSLQLLAMSNIGSVILYLFSFLLIRKNFLSLTFFCIETEIIVHSVAVSLLLNYDIGFTLYLIMLVPVSYFFLYLTKTKRCVTKATICSATALLVYVICHTVLEQAASVYNVDINAAYSTLATVFNSILVFGGLTLFSCIFLVSISKSMSGYDNQIQLLDTVASHDPLTGLHNRRTLESHMQSMIEHAESSNAKFTILIADIDDFKVVNDTYGHANGDIVLQKIADILRDMTRPNDYLCRWGGEEFLVVLSGIGMEHGVPVAERIRSKVEAYEFHLNGVPVHCTISIGAAEYRPGNSSKDLFKLADMHLYFGKTNGKNQVVAEIQNTTDTLTRQMQTDSCQEV
jgi:diguanylate cyclase (GGDEF)-like protein